MISSPKHGGISPTVQSKAFSRQQSAHSGCCICTSHSSAIPSVCVGQVRGVLECRPHGGSPRPGDRGIPGAQRPRTDSDRAGERITAMHVNHAVLMSVVAQRVSEATGVPFAVMPHGSAIEYAVKGRALPAARHGGFTAASRIFVIGDEMRGRVQAVFGEVPELDSKLWNCTWGWIPASSSQSPVRRARPTSAVCVMQSASFREARPQRRRTSSGRESPAT